MTITHGRPQVGRWRTRALQVDGSGPVLVLLHGFGDHAATWVPVLEELHLRGARAVALDLPNFGESDAFEPGSMIEQLDAFVAAAIEHWTVDGVPPVLVGNSLGGLVSLRAGAGTGPLPSGVVPVCPAGFGHSWFINLLERYSWLNPLMFTPVVPMGTFRYLAATFFSWAATGGTSVVRPGTARTFAGQFRGPADVKRVLGTAPGILAEIRSGADRRAPQQVPCLILWGRHDRLALFAGAQELAALVPGAELVELDDCGHCPQLSCPDVVAEHLVRFVGSLAEPIAG